MGTTDYRQSEFGDRYLFLELVGFPSFTLEYTPESGSLRPTWNLLGYWYVAREFESKIAIESSGPLYAGFPTLISPPSLFQSHGDGQFSAKSVFVKMFAYIPDGSIELVVNPNVQFESNLVWRTYLKP